MEPTGLDFGSLSAFLDAGQRWSKPRTEATAPCFSHGPARAGKDMGAFSSASVPGTSLPNRPQSDPFQDTANLNRKVAFKMLKQLGCQVCTVEPESDDQSGASSTEVFIEV